MRMTKQRKTTNIKNKFHCITWLKYLSLPVLLCLIISAKAQNKEVYSTSDRTEVTYQYNENAYKEGRIVNFFIEEIAKSIPKQIKYTKYNFSFYKTCRIAYTGNNHYVASVEFINAECDGDVMYKSFSISDAIIPPMADMTVAIKGRSVKPLASANLEHVPITSGYNKMASLEFNDTAKNFAYTFDLNITKIYYDDAAKNRFNDMRKLIDDYYQADFQIDEYNRVLDKFDFENIDMIIVYDIQLKEVEKAVETLFNRNFAGTLKLNEKDPTDYLDKFSKLSERSIGMREKMNVLLATLDKQYYEKGMGYYEKNEFQSAEKFFKRSISVNKYYSPAAYRLAKILYMRDSITEASTIISGILQNMNPDHNTRKLVVEMADTLYRAFIGHGNYFIVQEKFNEALSLFEACRNFCASTPGLKCDNEVSKGLSKSKYGIYKSYLAVAQKAMDNDKLDLAQVYIEEARKYQRNNSSEIIGDAECDAYIARLVRAYIKSGDLLAQKGRYEKALGYYQMASKYCTANTEYNCPNDLPIAIHNARIDLYNSLCKSAREYLKDKKYDAGESEIMKAVTLQQEYPNDISSSLNSDTILTHVKGIRYRQFIVAGRQLMHYDQMREAAGNFADARDLEKRFSFSRDYSLDSLLKATGLPVLLEEIKMMQLLAESGLADSARTQYNKLVLMQKRFMLDDDESANKAMEYLSGFIVDKKCSLATKNADAALASATICINNKDFIDADTLLQKALDIAFDNQGCRLDADAIMTLHNNYQPAADYQVIMKKAQKCYAAKNFKEFIDDYENAESLFYNAKLRNVGINHTAVLEYLSMQKDQPLISYAIQHYLLYGKVNEAFRLLKVLYAIGMTAADARPLQESVGEAMARIDKKSAPDASPRKTVAFYTGNQKWYAFFKKAYLFAWREQ